MENGFSSASSLSDEIVEAIEFGAFGPGEGLNMQPKMLRNKSTNIEAAIYNRLWRIFTIGIDVDFQFIRLWRVVGSKCAIKPVLR